MSRWHREGRSSYASKAYAVVLVDKEDKPLSTHWPPESTWAFDKLADKFQVVKAEGEGFVDTVYIPEEKAVWMTKVRTAPLACVFHSAKNVLKNLHGVEFSKEDEDWFLNHGLLKPGGVPLPDTFRVVQGLIAPYGFRVARVRIQPGLSIKGNMREWRAILGMNPMALADRTTSNAEYAEQVGQPLAEVNNLYRMEYNAEPYTSGVVCEASQTSEFGHASYAPPRRKASGNEWLSYQFSRVTVDPWTGEEPTWPYVQAEMEQVLDVWSIIREEEKTKVDMPFTLADAEGEPINAHVKLLAPPAPAKEEKLLAFQNAGMCRLCGEEPSGTETPFCAGCWNVIWDTYKCPSETCGERFEKKPPIYRGYKMEEGRLLAKCPTCVLEISLPAKDDVSAQMALRAMSGRLTREDRDDWQLYVQMTREVGV